MSSYLNFYLVPKKKEEDTEEPKPLLFNSYSRNSDVYSSFHENLHPVFIGSGDTPNYTEIKAEDVKIVVEAIKKYLNQVEDKLAARIEAYKTLTATPDKDAIDDYTSTKEHIKETQELVNELEGIYAWVSGIEYSSFDKVLINID